MRATETPIDEKRVLQRYRLIMVMIGIFYPLWRFYAYFISPNFFETFAQRGLIGALFLSLALLTYTHRIFRKYISEIFNAISFLWITQVFALIWANNADVDYLLVGLITVFCVGGSFLTKRSLLYFYLFCVVLTGVTVIISPHPETITFFFGVVFVLSISYACSTTLSAVFTDLHENKEALSDRASEYENLSAAVQTMFLPTETSLKEPGFEIAGYYRPADICGGDWWNYSVRRDESVLVFVGDITGHGPGSAMMTASVASYLKALRMSRPEHSASELLKDLNAHLVGLQKNMSPKHRYLMTMSAVEVDMRSKTLHLWSAGGPFPYLVDSLGGVKLLGGRGQPLGLAPDLVMSYEIVELNRGERLFLYTDGIIEMTIGAERQLGERRLKKIVSSTRPQSASEAVRSIELEFQKLKFLPVQEDDVTFVVLDIT